MDDHVALTLIVLTFAVAGVVKGVTGMGLPTVAIALLSVWMPPVAAAALLSVPSLVTNVWQFVAGEHRALLLRRMWTMIAAIGIATWAAAGLIAGSSADSATAALGVVLVIYAIAGLANTRMSISTRAEPWLSPIVGAVTGVVTGATGVMVIPAVPYLQALGLEKDDLVQALGLSFTASAIAMTGGLAQHGALPWAVGGASALCTLPALIGMWLGQWLRSRVEPAAFRRLFFVGLLVLGADLMLRSSLLTAR